MSPYIVWEYKVENNTVLNKLCYRALTANTANWACTLSRATLLPPFPFWYKLSTYTKIQRNSSTPQNRTLFLVLWPLFTKASTESCQVTSSSWGWAPSLLGSSSWLLAEMWGPFSNRPQVIGALWHLTYIGCVCGTGVGNFLGLRTT